MAIARDGFSTHIVKSDSKRAFDQDTDGLHSVLLSDRIQNSTPPLLLSALFIHFIQWSFQTKGMNTLSYQAITEKCKGMSFGIQTGV